VKSPFRGSLVALPTPFRGERADALDADAFRALVERQAESRTTGVVVAGTTGEAATLAPDERRLLVELAVEAARGRLHVVAGVGTNCTRTSVELARAATDAGADGLLVVTPYYNRPSARGLAEHFAALARAGALPLALYNVPSRTGTDLAPELAARIAAEHANVVAVKEALGTPERAREHAALGALDLLAGEDHAIGPFLRAGAVGVIGVVANLVPDRVAELVAIGGPAGDAQRASELEAELAPLIRALFVEVNPVPVKAARARLHGIGAAVRAPLAPLEAASRRTLDRALERAGLASPSPVR